MLSARDDRPHVPCIFLCSSYTRVATSSSVWPFIDLQIDKYCYKRPCRCSLEDKAEIENQIAQLLKHNLIEESYSPFAAPVTLAYKRDEDTIGGFGGQRSTKRYLHLLMDHFTRFAYILCSQNKMSRDFIKLMEKISKNNTIETLLADQYPAINSTEFKNYLKQRDIEYMVTIRETSTQTEYSNDYKAKRRRTIMRLPLRQKLTKQSTKSAIANCTTYSRNRSSHKTRLKKLSHDSI
ncbi:unnamed protein product [Trichogramma brassicae]|uniref:Uncharacterized protein n=1 Tax=Trichogramma brassicae TaxID=86971 RepID=A0A6H5INZ6_9HYME|nr:unnamed protein product [Trichogramma brassicae]